MKPFYLKGNYEGNPAFVMITTFPYRATAEMISYHEARNKWVSDVKEFDLSNKNQKQVYYNFLEQFFASNRSEFHVARKYLTKPPPINSFPKKSVEPIIPMEELLDKIKQFEISKGKSGDNNSANSINNQE